MAIIHISEAEAALDFPGLILRVKAGDEVLIERVGMPTVVMKAPPTGFGIEERMDSLPEGRRGVIDEHFAADVAAAVAANREPLDPPVWD